MSSTKLLLPPLTNTPAVPLLGVVSLGLPASRSEMALLDPPLITKPYCALSTSSIEFTTTSEASISIPVPKPLISLLNPPPSMTAFLAADSTWIPALVAAPPGPVIDMPFRSITTFGPVTSMQSIVVEEEVSVFLTTKCRAFFAVHSQAVIGFLHVLSPLAAATPGSARDDIARDHATPADTHREYIDSSRKLRREFIAVSPSKSTWALVNAGLRGGPEVIEEPHVVVTFLVRVVA